MQALRKRPPPASRAIPSCSPTRTCIPCVLGRTSALARGHGVGALHQRPPLDQGRHPACQGFLVVGSGTAAAARGPCAAGRWESVPSTCVRFPGPERRPGSGRRWVVDKRPFLVEFHLDRAAFDRKQKELPAGYRPVSIDVYGWDGGHAGRRCRSRMSRPCPGSSTPTWSCPPSESSSTTRGAAGLRPSLVHAYPGPAGRTCYLGVWVKDNVRAECEVHPTLEEYQAPAGQPARGHSAPVDRPVRRTGRAPLCRHPRQRRPEPRLESPGEPRPQGKPGRLRHQQPRELGARTTGRGGGPRDPTLPGNRGHVYARLGLWAEARRGVRRPLSWGRIGPSTTCGLPRYTSKRPT